MKVTAELKAAIRYQEEGRNWLNPVEAEKILGCKAESLTNAANNKGTLGSLQFYWAGTSLKISTMSIIRFLTGGYQIREIFGTGVIE